MDDDRAWQPDSAGSGSDQSSGLRRDPLHLVCESLNFTHSLLHEAQRLRRRVLDVLVDLSAGWEQAADRLERTAADARSSAAQERLLTAASRARTNVAATRRQWRRLAAVDVGEPPPTGREAGSGRLVLHPSTPPIEPSAGDDV
ncbi:hypothetical protein ACFPK1_28095 [Actinomycetospora rhizophila]|uniref:Uncharacterized protein n=1 Tax=Actinomycetospora rhizophila TaxID=1416876 RepID=A0ABV9ZL32_9PSEU